MITRRDFLDGVAIGIGSALVGCGGKSEPPPPSVPDYAPEQEPDYYPPARTGMRGSHPGAYEIAHDLRDGTLAMQPEDRGERYDLIVVGGGISGLAAAHYYRRAKGETAPILVLDNHDDVGGHAKRNEFTIDNKVLVSYGGTESIEYPSEYSRTAKQLLADIGIDIAGFPTAFPKVRTKDLGLAGKTFFSREAFGEDRLVALDDDFTAESLAKAPLADAVRAALVKLGKPVDYWPALSDLEKKARLAKLSYLNFLVEVAGVPAEALPLLQTATHSLYGVGIDAVPALDCWALEFPGFAGMKLDPKAPSPGLGKTPQLEMHDEPNVQFVDGNATIARMLVRRLLPAALPGSSMTDAVTARLDYARLDAPDPTKIRLNSTVVRVRDLPDGVEVTYIRGGKARIAHARHCVLACWNMVIPYLVRELPPAQKLALAYGTKVPLVYTNVAIRNWRAWKELGTSAISIPSGYFTSARLELHAYNSSPSEPAVVKLVRTPCRPGLSAREQHRLGRAELQATEFAVFEQAIRNLFHRMLGPGGFDPGRDIFAITVNRWSHGYAYEYNSLWDPIWKPGEAPCEIGRARFGHIAIANADAGAYAYTDCAIDQAKRAVDELG